MVRVHWHTRVRILAIATLGVWPTVGMPVRGQGLLERVLGERPAAGDAAPAPDRPPLVTWTEVEAATESLRQELAAISTEQTEENAVRRSALQGELELWRRIRLELQQLANVQAQSTELAARLTNLEQRFQRCRQQGLESPPPYSFLLIDGLVDQHYAQRQRQKASETEIELARDHRDRVAQRVDACRRRTRLAQEAHARAKPAEAARLHRQQRKTLLEQRLAEVQLALAQLEMDQQEQHGRLVDVEYEFLALQIELMKPEGTFEAPDLGEKVRTLTERAQEIGHLLQQLESLLDASEERLQAARLVSQQDTAHEEYLQTLQTHLRVLQAHERFLHDDLDRTNGEREIWQRRFQLANQSATADQVNQWRDQSRQRQKQLDKDKRVTTARLENVRTELAALESKNPPNESAATVREYRQRQLAELRQLIRIHETDLASIQTHRWSHSKLLTDAQQLSAIAAAAALVDSSWQKAGAIWNYEIVQVEGSPITIKKIVIGVSLVIFGYWMSRWISRFIGRSVLPRFGVEGNAAMPLRTMMFYILFLTFTLFALRIVCVPLTAFTVVGGALAIGVGVGSQSIANNFISGLILLAECPVRVGDTVEIDGMVGVVEKIGARSTRICTGKNQQLILPNSKLLEQKLTNWTLNDDRIRTSISVGIAHGSPTDRAAELMLVAARENDSILTTPAPQVYFVDFAEHALVLEIHYWFALSKRADGRMIESRLRFAIERLFRAENILVAHPQRDIHLQAGSPIRVHVSPASDDRQRHAA